MGEVELYTSNHRLVIRSTIFFYGEAADQSFAIQVADEIAFSWNEPRSMVRVRKEWYEVQFDVEGIYTPDLAPATVWHNTNPRYNYFRIEEFSLHDISFVDGLGSNTGYFKRANLQ
ncbi:MAG TPA: peptidase M10, partial [Puia sp.]